MRCIVCKCETQQHDAHKVTAFMRKSCSGLSYVRQVPSGTIASIAAVSDSLLHQAVQLTNFLSLLIMLAPGYTLYAPSADELHMW